MGQKVSPHGLRVGVIKDWDSKWYGDKKNFADFLAEDNYMQPAFQKFLSREHLKPRSELSFLQLSPEW